MSTWSNEEQPEVPRLQVILPVNVAFFDSKNYWMSRLHNHSLCYNEKMDSRMAKLLKRVKAIIKPYRFDENNLVTPLSF